MSEEIKYHGILGMGSDEALVPDEEERLHWNLGSWHSPKDGHARYRGFYANGRYLFSLSNGREAWLNEKQLAERVRQHNVFVDNGAFSTMTLAITLNSSEV